VTAEPAAPAPLVRDDRPPILRPLGAWVDEAACADLGLAGSEVFTADVPDPDELAQAEAVCWRCPVRQECADYAAQAPVWGLWGATWRGGSPRTQRVA